MMRRSDGRTGERPLRIAMTGGLAAGKSTVQEILREEGAAVLDTDEVAHRLMRRDGAVFDAVRDAFGSEILDAAGEIDRARLGERVFGDPDALRRLNALVHPAVGGFVADWLREQAAAGRDAVVTVPLLFEADLATGWDAILCVVAPPETVRQRLRQRGLGDAQIEARLAAQWPVEEKMKRADFVVENRGTPAQLQENVLEIWRELARKENAYHG